MSDPRHTASAFPVHRQFVGRPEAFDLLGARHFMLLFLLGLREHHTLLDFGCGSLRSGRLVIAYLAPGRYIGFDPNAWLIEAAIEHEIGGGLAEIKRPRFVSEPSLRWADLGVPLDFVHAHSVLTHAPMSLVQSFFEGAGAALAPEGLVLATYLQSDFDHAGSEWVYPELAGYRRSTMTSIAQSQGLEFAHLRWPHTEQTYFVAARNASIIQRALAEVLETYGLDLKP